MRLAIVDDHPRFAASVATALRDAGMEVRWTASNIPDALEALRARPVDAVVVDLTVNGCDGARVAELLQWVQPSVSVLLHSPFFDGTMTASARDLGYRVVCKVDGVDGLLMALAGVDVAASALA